MEIIPVVNIHTQKKKLKKKSSVEIKDTLSSKQAHGNKMLSDDWSEIHKELSEHSNLTSSHAMIIIIPNVSSSKTFLVTLFSSHLSFPRLAGWLARWCVYQKRDTALSNV